MGEGSGLEGWKPNDLASLKAYTPNSEPYIPNLNDTLSRWHLKPQTGALTHGTQCRHRNFCKPQCLQDWIKYPQAPSRKSENTRRKPTVHVPRRDKQKPKTPNIPATNPKNAEQCAALARL